MSHRLRVTGLVGLGVLHGLLSIGAVYLSVLLAGLVPLVFDGARLVVVWALLAVAAVAGPVVGVVALVRAARRRRWVGWIAGGWAASLVALLPTLGGG